MNGSRKNIKEFDSQIQKKNFPQVAFLCGEEEYYIANALDSTQANSKELNYSFEIFNSDEVSPQEIIDHASEFSLFGEKKVIVIKEFGSLNKKEKLIPYFQNPSHTTCLILVENSKINFSQNKTYKTLESLNYVYESYRLKENEILEYIEKRFKSKKINIDFEVVNLIYSIVGNNLFELDAEIGKILMAVEGKNSVSKELVSSLVVSNRQYSIFDLYNALRDKKFDLALKIGYNLLDGDATLVYIIVMLHKYFFNLLTFQELKKITNNEKELASKIGSHPFYLKDYELASKRYGFMEISKIFELLLQKDIELKSTTINERTQYAILIGEIMSISKR